jgi:Lon protease-like protein
MIPATIPIFPLPNAILFPKVLLPLHIFEPRYRVMIEDALAGEGVIGMVLLRPGYEANYEGRPPVYPVGCAGSIVQADRLANGRFNILLRGTTKFRIAGEDVSRAYRLARVETIAEAVDEGEVAAMSEQRQRLLGILRVILERMGSEARFPSDLPDDELVNGFAQNLDLEPLERQALLERPGVLQRCRALADLLEMRAHAVPGGWERKAVH